MIVSQFQFYLPSTWKLSVIFFPSQLKTGNFIERAKEMWARFVVKLVECAVAEFLIFVWIWINITVPVDRGDMETLTHFPAKR